MSIGLGIALIAIGAILVYALNFTVDWIDIDMVGYILMGAGAVIVIIGIVLLARRRRSVATTHTQVDPASGERLTRSENSTPDL
ncbi:DUF6458 family protein [Microterricola viridarii]|uniref:DUF6458 domain-containing protein n=1 Tax=Microterricola viridarii TaxID=412690 RepID=A0A1H1PG77_9MICO|nr:DUF6458 family protein [Microterricola viridarii]SDS10080.1 hypothetical protein SAMN04489834_0863 [Microterricola viridarii]